jgi:hypothetical protein
MRRSKSSAIRSPQDRDREPLTINHRERLWDRRSEIATAPIGIFPPKKIGSEPACRRPAMVAKTFQRQNAHPHPVAQQAPFSS